MHAINASLHQSTVMVSELRITETSHYQAFTHRPSQYYKYGR